MQRQIEEWLRGPIQTDENIIAQIGETVIDRLVSVGVSVPRMSRIADHVRRVQDAASHASWPQILSLEQAEPLLQGMAEIEELHFILNQLDRIDLCGREPKQVLQPLVGGAELPRNQRGESFARSLQYELFVAAVLTAGGAPVRLEEPDVVIEVAAREFGIAAKKLRSHKKFYRRISDASDQIRSGRRLGVIAIDVSSAMQADVKILAFKRPEEIVTPIRTLSKGLIEDGIPRIESHTDGALVGAIIMTCTVRASEEAGPLTTFRSITGAHLNEIPGTPRTGWFDEIEDIFAAGFDAAAHSFDDR